jgi:hypothetical protein
VSVPAQPTADADGSIGKYLPATFYLAASGVLATAFVAVFTILLVSPEQGLGEIVLLAGLALDLVVGAMVIHSFEARRRFIYTSQNAGLDALAEVARSGAGKDSDKAMAALGDAGKEAEKALEAIHAFRDAAFIRQARRDAQSNIVADGKRKGPRR